MKIRSYAKQELAMLYFPEALPHTAVNRLTGWIKRCEPLCRQIAACQQPKRAKFFTSKEVALIVEFLGEP